MTPWYRSEFEENFISNQEIIWRAKEKCFLFRFQSGKYMNYRLTIKKKSRNSHSLHLNSHRVKSIRVRVLVIIEISIVVPINHLPFLFFSLHSLLFFSLFLSFFFFVLLFKSCFLLFHLEMYICSNLYMRVCGRYHFSSIDFSPVFSVSRHSDVLSFRIWGQKKKKKVMSWALRKVVFCFLVYVRNLIACFLSWWFRESESNRFCFFHSIACSSIILFYFVFFFAFDSSTGHLNVACAFFKWFSKPQQNWNPNFPSAFRAGSLGVDCNRNSLTWIDFS